MPANGRNSSVGDLMDKSVTRSQEKHRKTSEPEQDFAMLCQKMDSIYETMNKLVKKEDLDYKLNGLKRDIFEKNNEMIEKLESRIFDVECLNDNLRKKVSNLEKRLNEKEEKMDTFLRSSEIKINDLEQQGRKNSIRIYGLPDDRDEKDEECVAKVVKLVTDKLKVTCSARDIDIAHRMGEFNNGKPRSVICKFTHRRQKAVIIRHRRALKSTGIVIVEDSTAMNRGLMKKVLDVEGVQNSWSMDGKMFVKLKNGKVKKITHQTPLEKLTEWSKKSD